MRRKPYLWRRAPGVMHHGVMYELRRRGKEARGDGAILCLVHVVDDGGGWVGDGFGERGEALKCKSKLSSLLPKPSGRRA
jgi:hypothetical protein